MCKMKQFLLGNLSNSFLLKYTFLLHVLKTNFMTMICDNLFQFQIIINVDMHKYHMDKKYKSDKRRKWPIIKSKHYNHMHFFYLFMFFLYRDCFQCEKVI